MPKSGTEEYSKSSDKRPRSASRSTVQVTHVVSNCGLHEKAYEMERVMLGVLLRDRITDEEIRRRTKVPLHFSVHKQGCHFESCCGVCNLFPGVLLIAFSQVLVGAVLLTLILTHGKQYDEMHQTPTTQMMSLATGAALTGVAGAGVFLIIVALTENCRAMLIYLLVATLIWIDIVALALTKIGRACVRFKDAPKIKDEQHRLANLACVCGLFTFFGAVVYFFSLVVVFSFYHFRYVRRAILMHEAECNE